MDEPLMEASDHANALAAAKGEEFRDDLRAICQISQDTSSTAKATSAAAQVGSGNAAARKILLPAELAPFTQLSNARSMLAVLQTLGLIALGIAGGVATWGTPWIIAPILLLGIAQHGLFILSHESAHYRLLSNRKLNDALGRAIGFAGGVSMLTYRVTHRLHHNNLYTSEDPDTAIHGGYPRGKAYLWRKLAQDVVGLNAWKTYAYFFGSPAINEQTGTKINPLNDTSPELRQAARADRWWVVGFHVAAPIVVLLLGNLHGLFLYVVLWLLPLLTVLQPILRLRAICEHGAVFDFSSPLTAARSNNTRGSLGNVLARLFLFPHHVNYHLEHHLYPAVPHYNLPRLHALLELKGALQGAEVRDVADTFDLIFALRRSKNTPTSTETSHATS